ncbi:ligand-binding sensor domain-containing protein [Cyclobacterium qasimii]|uniref:ligand-binding sensor domain-containing protein n=1 Tax=Cyclobacterium qasimii TaxID=1350429 RepID=UPI00041EEF29|nr:sensor histidine kinase [Cyclobacterium qasimii]
MKTSEGLQLNNSLVKVILPHTNGQVWIGTDHGGINIVNKNKDSVKYLLNEPDNLNSLSNNAVYALYEDDQGIVWVGTFKGGVELFHPHSSRFALVRREIDTSNPFPWNDVNAFEEDATGEIYVGTNGGGLWKYSPDNGEISNIVKLGNDAIPENLVVVDLFTDHQGVLWIGTYQDGLYAVDGASVTHYEADLDNPDGLKDSNVWKIFEDSKRRLWIGTLREGLFQLDRKRNNFVHFRENGKGMPLTVGYVTGITEDDKGNIWVSGNNGINVFNPDTGYLKNYLVDSPGASFGLSSNEISDLVKDKQGVIWASTNKGLCYFDEQTSRFVVFNEANGVKNKLLVGLEMDNKNNLWLSSQEGIIHAKINRTEPLFSAEFRVFNSGDGLQGDYYNKNALFLSKKGKVYFGGSDGFNFVDPSTFPFYEEESHVVFSEFQLFNQSIAVNEQVNGRILLPSPLNKKREIQLNHDENIFSVSFSSMNYLNPEKNSFQYKLEGFNNDWISLSNAPFEVSFTNLDPGNYRLLVKASNIDGIPGTEISSLAITVLAPFWKTDFAYFVYFIAFVLFVLLAWKWFVGKERSRLKRLDEIKEIHRLAELDQMKSRFFTNISHEFRTPLTLILAPIDKLMEKEGEDSANFYLKTIQKNAKKLLALVNQLMDVKNIEMQTIKLVLSEGDIISLIEDQVRTYQSLSVNTNIGLTFSSDVRNIPCSFDIDKVKK